MGLKFTDTLLLLFTASLFSLSAQTDEKSQELRTLMRTWKYAKCKILQITYPPEKNEAEDLLTLNKDGSFFQIDNGQQREGIWEYLEETKELLLHLSNSGIIEKLVIETLKNDELILRKSEAWRFDVIIYMKADSYH